LAYENASLRKPAGLSAAQLDKQSLALQRLEAIEQGLKDGVKIVLRERSLEMAHAGFVKQFANTPGFGAARQIFRPSPSVTRLTEDRRFPVPLMKTYLDLDSSKPDYPTPPGVAAIPSSREDSAWRLHRDGLLHFLYPEGFGYIRDRDHIAGFRPHQFRTYPQSWPFSWEPKPQKETWLLTQLELVSLLKYDKPAVYVSDSLPSMADIGQYETRSLDAFEASALPLLQAGEDLTKELKDKNLSILGSIRATKQCLKCHDAKRGDLLGAFTYKLRREPAPR
jgi:hypothetical protein